MMAYPRCGLSRQAARRAVHSQHKPTSRTLRTVRFFDGSGHALRNADKALLAGHKAAKERLAAMEEYERRHGTEPLTSR